MSTVPRKLTKRERAEVLDPAAEDPTYPSRDGKRMSDHTEQFDWIVAIKLGIDAKFRDDPEVFVAGDLLWYPVRGEPKIRAAPDTLIAFGRPKGARSCYKQWQEGGIAPQVVFEVLSPGNRRKDLLRKLEFYDLYGVEEYYQFDPFRGVVKGWIRDEMGRLVPIGRMTGWPSPRLGLTFGLEYGKLILTDRDGRRILAALDVYKERDDERARADDERARADDERARADDERARAERLSARLRELGLDPDA